MKLEIDLNDILGDEYGSAETLAESVRRQVIEQVTKTVQDGIGDKVNAELSRVIDEQISAAIGEKMPAILDDLLNTEYVMVSRYGNREGVTTFRKQLVAAIHEQMKYVKANYDSDKNVFTRAVDSIVKEQVESFKSEFNKKVDADFTKAAMEYACKKLREKLGIS